MELLLDTCTLIWTLFDDKRLSKSVKDLINDNDNDIYVSTASLWEIMIKNNKRPDTMPYSLDDIFDAIVANTDFVILPIRPQQLFVLNEIIEQKIHQDPFDHIIMATSQVENLPLVTCDEKILSYQGLKTISY